MTSLDDLIPRIVAEHAAVTGALTTALVHAVAAGELLIKAKRWVRRDGLNWEPWVERFCKIPARTARHYMKLARERHTFSDANGNMLPKTVRGALNLLRHPEELKYDRYAGGAPTHGGAPAHGMSLADVRRRLDALLDELVDSLDHGSGGTRREAVQVVRDIEALADDLGDTVREMQVDTGVPGEAAPRLKAAA